MWRTVAAQKQAFGTEAERWIAITLMQTSDTLRSTLLGSIAARARLSALVALHAWAAILTASRNEAIELLFMGTFAVMLHK